MIENLKCLSTIAKNYLAKINNCFQELKDRNLIVITDGGSLYAGSLEQAEYISEQKEVFSKRHEYFTAQLKQLYPQDIQALDKLEAEFLKICKPLFNRTSVASRDILIHLERIYNRCNELRDSIVNYSDVNLAPIGIYDKDDIKVQDDIKVRLHEIEQSYFNNRNKNNLIEQLAPLFAEHKLLLETILYGKLPSISSEPTTIEDTSWFGYFATKPTNRFSYVFVKAYEDCKEEICLYNERIEEAEDAELDSMMDNN